MQKRLPVKLKVGLPVISHNYATAAIFYQCFKENIPTLPEPGKLKIPALF